MDAQPELRLVLDTLDTEGHFLPCQWIQGGREEEGHSSGLLPSLQPPAEASAWLLQGNSQKTGWQQSRLKGWELGEKDVKGGSYCCLQLPQGRG